MNLNTFIKIESPQKNGWVSYYHHSRFVSANFSAHFNENGKVDALNSMSRIESVQGDFYVKEGVHDEEITELEFKQAMLKVIEFVMNINPNERVSQTL